MMNITLLEMLRQNFGICLVAEDDGRYAVEAENATVQPADTATLPDELELVAIDTTPAQTHVILEDANEPSIKAKLDEAGGTAHLWTANVILRNKTTLEPDHNTETSFVISYPNGIDATNYQDYTFVVMHLKPLNADGVMTSEAVIIPEDDVVAEADGLHITSTLSPFAISYGLTAPSQPSTPGTPSQPSAPGTPDTPGSNDSAGTAPGGTTSNGGSNDGTGSNTNPGAGSGAAGADSNASGGTLGGTSVGAQQSARMNAPASSANTNDATGTIQAGANGPTSEEELMTLTYGRMHIGHDAAAFLADPFWYLETLNEIWVALIGAALLAILAVVIGTVGIIRRNKKSNPKTH